MTPCLRTGLVVSALLLTVLMFRCNAAPLPAGVPVIASGDPTTALLSSPGASAATATVAPVQGQPFAAALHVETLATTPNPWDIQTISPTIAPVKQGDALLLTFYVRALNPNDGSARISAGFEKAGEPYTKSLDFVLTPPSLWTRIDLPFTSQDTYAPGEAHMHILFGFKAQAIEVGGLALTDYGQGISTADLPRFALTYAGREPNAPWRAAAAARIDKYRKANLVVHVVDAAGKPISGAQAHLAMTRPAFGFSTAVARDFLLRPGADNDTYRTHLLDLFDKAAPENDLKYWSWINAPSDDSTAGIAEVAWLRAHHLRVRGHNLVWPSWLQSPASLRTDFEAQVQAHGSDAARAWLARKLAAHITEEVTVLKGQCEDWDVINEPNDNHDFMDLLGDSAMTTWFKTAHTADPAARLFVNQDGVFYGQSDEARVHSYQRVIQTLLAQGAPLGGIGLESHFGTALPTPDQLVQTLTEDARFGVPLEITEYDLNIDDKQLQADYTRDFLTICFSEPSVTTFQMWGFWDGSQWLNNAPVYFKDWTLKPSGQVFVDLVKHQWRTDAHGTTNAAGAYGTRGFLGDYDVTVTANGKTATKSVTLDRTDKSVTIVLR